MQSHSHPKTGVWFPHWPAALAQQRLLPLHRQQYRRAIIEFLQFLNKTRQRATVDSARQFMHEVEARRRLALSQLARWKEA